MEGTARPWTWKEGGGVRGGEGRGRMGASVEWLKQSTQLPAMHGWIRRLVHVASHRQSVSQSVSGGGDDDDE